MEMKKCKKCDRMFEPIDNVDYCAVCVFDEIENTNTLKTQKELYELAKPLQDWLSKNYHPHTKIILDSNQLEVMEGLIGINNLDCKVEKPKKVINALQWTGTNKKELFEFLGEDPLEPRLEYGTVPFGKHFLFDYEQVEGGLILKFNNRHWPVRISEYVVIGKNGDIFSIDEHEIDGFKKSLKERNVELKIL